MRPGTFFPLPCDLDGTEAAARTDCASTMPAEGPAWWPSRSLTRPRSRSWNSAISPWSRHQRKKA
ncbi:hypothetical protein ACFCYM_29355 [Streptomyces sp. NPDC056254]|uniref:hypothetical protein n=1 Tax=Streptomyces sp. NPDC056254 TaxID=3345763 RepID=UPI0035DF122D